MRRRGATLIEIMVWSVLALLTLGMAVFMVMQILRYARRETDRSHGFLGEVRSLTWLSEDLRFANASGLVVHESDTGPTYLCIHSPSVSSDSQQARFDNRLVFYHWDPQARVLRRCVAASPMVSLNSFSPTRPTFAELEGYRLDPRLERRQLADFVTSFKIRDKNQQLLTPNRMPSPLTIQLQTVSPDGKQTFLQERLLSVRTTS